MTVCGVDIDLYPVLGLAMGALFTWLVPKMKAMLQYVAVAGIGLFMLLNLFQSAQYVKGLIHYDSMTFEAYMAVFGKWNAPENYEELLETPDYEAAKLGEGR